MNFHLPQKRKKPLMGLKQPEVLRVPGFLRDVRKYECACRTAGNAGQRAGLYCMGSTEAAHVRIGTDGGVGMKPSDRHSLPLCSGHHLRQHQIGEKAFEKETGISMRTISDGMWNRWLKTDTGRRWAIKTGYTNV